MTASCYEKLPGQYSENDLEIKEPASGWNIPPAKIPALAFCRTELGSGVFAVSEVFELEHFWPGSSEQSNQREAVLEQWDAKVEPNGAINNYRWRARDCMSSASANWIRGAQKFWAGVPGDSVISGWKPTGLGPVSATRKAQPAPAPGKYGIIVRDPDAPVVVKPAPKAPPAKKPVVKPAPVKPKRKPCPKESNGGCARPA